MRRIGLLLSLWPALVAPPAVAGDGSWTQIDLWRGGVQWATTVERGRWHLGTSAGQDDDGWWTRASVMRTWTAGPDRAPWKLRGGLAMRAKQIHPWEVAGRDHAGCLSSDPDRCGTIDAGPQIEVDRWAEYGRWGTFVMAQWTGIDNAALAVGGLTHLPTGIGGQLSIWHEDGGDVTPTVMVTVPLTKRIMIRAGHKFVENETFVGFSLSTY